jgi:hypothetical protein
MPSALSDSASIFLNGVACSQEKVAPAASKLNLRVLLTSFASALFAGVVAALATFAVEKLGGVKGGILAATPTTILPALVGIKNNSSSFDDFAASVWILPVGALCNSIFLASWRYGPPLLPRRWTVPHKCVSPCALNHHFYYSVFGLFLTHEHRLLSIIAASLTLWLCAVLIVKGLLLPFEAVLTSPQLLTFTAQVSNCSAGALLLLETPKSSNIIVGCTCLVVQLLAAIFMCLRLPPAPPGVKVVSFKIYLL